MLRFLFKTFLLLFALSFGYLVLCKWMMPPITLRQLSDRLMNVPVTYLPKAHKDISPNLRLAIIASEDQLFPDHQGFDWKAIHKSLEGDRKTSRGTVQAGGGASTLSQQVAKNVFLWQSKDPSRYVRKVLEVPYTWLIEKIWGKQRILDVYLNIAEMGTGIYGAEAAAQHYFQKPSSDLTLTEASYIAACLPNPKVFTVKPMSGYVAWRAGWIRKQIPYLKNNKKMMKLVQ